MPLVKSGSKQARETNIKREIEAGKPPKQAEAILKWRATRSLAEMCRDGWAWQRANPQGYGSPTSA